MRSTPLFIILTLYLVSCSGGSDNPSTPTQPSISGTVSGDGNVAGITINVGNSSVVTDQSGNYTTEVSNGTYEVAPEEDGHLFEPESRTVVVSDAPQENVDFVAYTTSDIMAFNLSWDLLNPSVQNVEENTSSKLNLALAENALWYEGNQGGLVYRYVKGNFTLSATVSVRKTSDADSPVECDVCLGGLMARNPNSSQGQNYVHIVSGNTPQGLGYETKNTTNSTSPFEATSNGTTDHDLRMCRDGSTFRLYQRAVGTNTWNLAATYDRPDLPATLQVGFNIYTAQSGALADLRTIYENVQLQTFEGSPGCQ
ncbi:MAG: carboxypeptidase regulatory-like domain-containing protein [Cytophagia bacterium]|nr:carboxypeptidase regulatory-like domain-containing protein [Cytophagia bacterium]